MRINLLVRLHSLFGQRFLSQLESNFKKINNTIDSSDDEFKKHKKEETNAHNSKQITHLNTNVGDMLIYQMERIRNLVLGVDGNGIKEVTDSRVANDGTPHGLLSERLLYDFNNVKKEIERLDQKFVEINFNSYKPDKNGKESVSKQLQDAFNKIHEAGAGKLFIPSGTYLLNERVDVYENTTVELDKNARILRGNTNELFMNGPYTDKFYGYEGRGNIHFIGGIFDGNYEQLDKYPTKAANHINLKHAQNISFTNCVFRNVISYHALDVNGVRNLRVKDCIFEGYINLADKTKKEAIQLSEYTRDTIAGEGYYDGTPCQDIIVQGCTFKKSDILDAHTVAVGNHLSTNDIYQSNITISNNTFEDLTEVGVRPYKWKNVRVENNSFIRVPQGIRVSSVGPNDVSAQAPDGTPSNQAQAGSMYFITNNFFSEYKEFGISIYGNQTGTKTALVTDVMIKDNVFNCDNKSVGEAVNLRLCQNVQVKDNTVNQGRRAVRFLGCNIVSIENNTVNDVGTEAFFNEKSTFTGLQEFNRHIHINNNFINGSGKNSIFLEYVKNFFIRNNVINNPNQVDASSVPRGGIYLANCDSGSVEGNFVWGKVQDFSVRAVDNKNINFFNNGGAGNLSVKEEGNNFVGFWNVDDKEKIVRKVTKEG
ncbi:right-handed parallel beta-helix repeat-containing protein [Staphylococcus coagulans]|uniref:right-handed parallel beta-helix repeat-containing protein n=1 Tax=Staphylococcus coagulans TaxID=74706 RepID=UPI001F4C343D|nr:right-handed parallel beta-helix repeat-containing protein [Staphylococcus coagulans]UNB45554.1 right-handed parallel beta-helix repeat-containing protein [Staphylococcus coagulans]